MEIAAMISVAGFHPEMIYIYEEKHKFSNSVDNSDRFGFDSLRAKAVLQFAGGSQYCQEQVEK
ncbi:MAG: hypothetical protein K8S20_02335 [Chloroflexi bacterium]|nr:hypothetical protein [Chloroflexota bacterium]